MSAVLYIVAGVPLLLCWVSVFLVIAVVLAAVIIGNVTQPQSIFSFITCYMFTILLLSDYHLHGGARDTVAEAECADPGPKLPAVWLAIASGDESARPLIISKSQEESQSQQSRIGAFRIS